MKKFFIAGLVLLLLFLLYRWYKSRQVNLMAPVYSGDANPKQEIVIVKNPRAVG